VSSGVSFNTYVHRYLLFFFQIRTITKISTISFNPCLRDG